ncbi:MAG TPA: hypothetical protein VH083_23650, partial [Myxococcales bacterium]|nr:hypothetical protein [Myxococcales bacterium]
QIGSLAADGETRAFSREVFRAAVARRSPKRIVEEYFPVLTPRLTVLLLSPGLVAASSWMLLPSELAGFKVSLSFVTAAASMVPISQYVLQAHWMDSTRKAMDREVRLIVGSVLLAGVIFGLGLWLFGDVLRGFVLRTNDPALHKFNVVFFAVPFFVLIGPVSSLFIARDRVRELVFCFLASLIAAGAGIYAGGPAWGFVAGSAAFVLTAATRR